MIFKKQSHFQISEASEDLHVGKHPIGLGQQVNVQHQGLASPNTYIHFHFDFRFLLDPIPARNYSVPAGRHQA
jgi:hypothetical protein